MKNTLYIAPRAEKVELLAKSIILVSGLDDYEDNNIFSDSVAPDSLDGIVL